MKSLKSSGSFKPFKDLEKHLKNQSINLSSRSTGLTKNTDLKFEKHAFQSSTSPPKRNGQSIFQEDNALFAEAMADVKPLLKNSQPIKSRGIHLSQPDFQDQETDNESEIIIRLKKLVQHGEGFVVAQTSEYAEWTGFNVNPYITRRLHQGDFTIQGHVDLHGLSVQDAKMAFDDFLKDAIATQKHAVLIVHGRGLSSPSKPVLKSKVYEWLTSGENKKWVVAFSSARLCDGGAGATVVLLRHHPLPKRFRKKQRKIVLDKKKHIL